MTAPNSDIAALSKTLDGLKISIANYLAGEQKKDGSFPARSFYGESFALLLWSCFGDRFRENIDSAMNCYSMKDKSDPEFHWEFNNFALLKYFNETGDKRVLPFIAKLNFKGTTVTNWTLLRAVCRMMARKGMLKGWKETVLSLLKFQKKGFILDDKKVRSFQYHCFSAALLSEFHELTGNRRIEKHLLNAVEFISHFIMPNGDTLYIGRGQQQIFGYGCLIYILAYSFRITGDHKYIYLLHKVLDFVSAFQREDGSFPLVLRKEEEGYLEVIDTNNPNYCGWYAYNNYFDYISFFGYWTAETSYVLKSMKQSKNIDSRIKRRTGIAYRDRNFLVFENKHYRAVISKPGGYWTNDMPIPYICYQGESVTPCYGGEQFGKSIYSPEGIPLPYGILNGQQYFFRDNLDYSLRGYSLIGEGEKAVHVRRFEFREREVIIRDSIELLNFSFDDFFHINFLVFPPLSELDDGYHYIRNGIKISVVFSENTIVVKKPYYSASGELRALRNTEKPNSKFLDVQTIIRMERLQ